MATGKILVVEDEPNIRLYLNEVLTNDGYEVVTATNGEEAVRLLAGQEFDLALLDLMLGSMSGLEVLAALKQQWPDTVVIILTAHGTLESAVDALRQDVHDYLFKPCETAQLRHSIEQGLLKRRHKLQQRRLLQKLEQGLAQELANIRTAIATDPVTPAQAALPSSPPPGHFLERGGLVVDTARHLITIEGSLLDLSLTEFALLAYLVAQAPRVIAIQELIREIQGYNVELNKPRDLVRQHIHNIRLKIKETTGRTDVIRTVRGVGYTIHL